MVVSRWDVFALMNGPQMFLAWVLSCLVAIVAGSCPPGKNLTRCCEQVGYHANEACRAYSQYGYSDANCGLWRSPPVAACQQHCGNCTPIALAVFEICRFSLAFTSIPGFKVDAMCRESQSDFLRYRCPAACDSVDESNCTGTVEGRTCMSECGNYANCGCRKQRGTLLNDVCDGSTRVNIGKPNTHKNYTCVDTPTQCRTNIAAGLTCSRYRLCPPDMCLIKNISCPPLDQCTRPGICDPADGRCYYNDASDGTPCDDGVYYTVNDQCVRGVCRGTENYCLKLNVTCDPVSECLLNDGVCHGATGVCTYSRRPNGYPCDDKRANTVNDQCEDGFCSGKMVDLCIANAINCTAQLPNDCHAPGLCDPTTGQCGLAIPLNGKRCNDGDPTTGNESCIDGVCIGQPLNWEALKFETLGNGECTDRSGFQTASYFGDVKGEAECESVCRSDPQCIAFVSSPPVCRIFGTIRTKAPQQGDWFFMLGTVPSAVVVEEAKSVEGQRESICRKKSEIGDKLEVDRSGQIEGKPLFEPLVLLGVFTLLALVFCWRPILKCVRVCFCCRDPAPEQHMVEHRIMVKSASDLASSPDKLHSPDSQDLRMIASHSWQPVDTEPTSPDKLPPALILPPDSPEPLTPSQALSPMTLTPLGRSPISIAWEDTTPDSPPSGKRWMRPTANKKTKTQGVTPKASGDPDLQMKRNSGVGATPVIATMGRILM